MLSTQRLIMIIIGINIIIGLVGAIYNEPTVYSSNRFTEAIDYNEQFGKDLDSEDKYSGTTNRDYDSETTIGNSITTGSIIWDVFWTGLYPLSVHPSMFETQIEKIFANILIIFRALMWILIGVELYLFIKNKKTS